MGLAGIPWWTTDIGGFHGGDPNDPAFRELFIRWFQWGAFCPVMRLHGDREPRQPQYGTTGGATCCSGAANEVWSYGEKVYEICKTYIELREKLRPYTRMLMQEAHEKGTPVMRTLFYEYPEDLCCWDVEDEYLYGSDLLIAPILEAGTRTRKVYLPKGAVWVDCKTSSEYVRNTGYKIVDEDMIYLPKGAVWVDCKTSSEYDGGQWVEADAPLEWMPVFMKKEAIQNLKFC